MPLTRNRVQNKSFYCMFLSHGLKKFVKARKSPEKDYCQGDVSARSHWLMVSGASCVKGVMGSDTSAHALWATQRRSKFKNTIILHASGEQLRSNEWAAIFQPLSGSHQHICRIKKF